MINTNYVSVKWGAGHGKAPWHFVLSTKPNSEFQQCAGLILTGFQVSLSKLDWGSTIIAPISYQANYCAGSCTFPLSKVSNNLFPLSKESNHLILLVVLYPPVLCLHLWFSCCVSGLERTITAFMCLLYAIIVVYFFSCPGRTFLNSSRARTTSNVLARVASTCSHV